MMNVSAFTLRRERRRTHVAPIPRSIRAKGSCREASGCSWRNQRFFSLFQSRRGVCKGRVDVVSFEIGIRRQDALACLTGGEESKNGTDGDAKTTNTGLASHDGGVVSDPGYLHEGIVPFAIKGITAHHPPQS